MKERRTKLIGFLIFTMLALGLIPAVAFAETESPAQATDQGLQAAQIQAPALTTQGDDTCVTMSVGEAYEASVEEGGYWLGSFTATQDGTYIFSSSGSYDTYGELYADADLDDSIDEDDDDGSENNFSIKHRLETGETVYLKARGYSYRAAEFTVSVTMVDPRDLSIASFQLSKSQYEITGSPVKLSATVVDAAGNTLVVGTHYELVYYRSDSSGDLVKLDSAPSAQGEYSVEAQAIEGGGYQGKTSRYWFTIYDPADISCFEIAWDGSSSIDYTESQVVLPNVILCRYDENAEDYIYLTEGTDFQLTGFETSNGIALDQAPIDPGSYYAVYEGIKNYYGTNKIRFRIVGDDYDLTFATIDLYRTVYEYDGNPVSLSVDEVLDTNGWWLSSDLYDFVYYDDQGKKLNAAPSDVGDYSVAVCAAESTSYYGESKKRASFAIVGVNDLRNEDVFGYSFIGKHGSNVPLNTAGIEPPAILIRDYNEAYDLVEGTDYEFSQYLDSEEKAIDSAPSTAGYYYAVYRGINNYTGAMKVQFRVCDPKDLSSATLSVNNSSNVPLIDGAAIPDVTVTDILDSPLTLEKDFELRYYTSDDYDDDPNGSANPPTTTGWHYVAAVPATGTSYTGATSREEFYVYDPCDLKNWSGRFYPSSSIVFTGEAVQLPMPVIYRLSKDSDGYHDIIESVLKEGTDYQLSYIENEDGERIGTTVPTDSGEYYAVYEGIGAQYHGTKSLYFEIYDANDIGSSYWTSSFRYGSTYYTTGDPIELSELLVYTYDNEDILVEGEDFEFAYFEDDEGTRLDVAPSESGTYYAVYQAKGSRKGTISKRFSVSNAFDLSSGKLLLSNSDYEYTGQPVVIEAKVRDADKALLEENVHYELAYYQDGEKLTGAPKAEGEYEVCAVAVDGGAYKGQTEYSEFTIGEISEPVIVEPQKMSQKLPSEMDISVDAGSYWVGEFTAPEDSLYSFWSTGDYDSYGYLYNDATLKDLLKSNDDSGSGANFQMNYVLKKDQTVYLKVRQYGNNAMTCTVHVDKPDNTDLSFADFWVEDSDLVLIDDTVSPDVVAKDALGATLVEGRDYKLVYDIWDDDEEAYRAIDGLPSEPGYYRVKAVAITGGTYHGSTSTDTFRVESGNNLSTAALEMKERYVEYTGKPVQLKITVTSAAGTVLKEGVDYELVYYTYAYAGYEESMTAPTLAGENYYVTARAKSGSRYTGSTGWYYFDVIDVHDLATNGGMIFTSPLYYLDVGASSVPVYLSTGSAVTPDVIVSCSGETLDSTDYSITYSNNTKASTSKKLASVTVTGKGSFGGSYSEKFFIVDRINLADYLWEQGCDLIVDNYSQHYRPIDSYKPQFLANGSVITPSVKFGSYTDVVPVQGTDFTVEITDVNGDSVTQMDPGKYRAVITATRGGLCTGSISVPFNVVSVFEFEVHNVRPTLKNGSSFTYSYYNLDGVWVYQVCEVVTNIDAFNWKLFDGDVELVDGVDYQLESTYSETDHTFTYVFTGKGGYIGTTKALVHVAGSVEESFNMRYAVINDRAGNVVYLDDNGNLITPSVTVRGLIEGVDYNCTGLCDGDGKELTKAAIGDTVFARVEGAGTYAGLVRTLAVKVVEGSDSRVVQTITAADKSVKVGKTVELNAKTSGNGMLTYASSNKAVATVSTTGVVTGVSAGTATITITATATSTYKKATKTVKVTVSKNANTLVTKSASKKLKFKQLKKKKKTFAVKVIKTVGQGKVTYKTKKVTKKYKKYVKVASNGKITVKKKAPKGKVKLTLTVKAAGNAAYSAATKTAKVTITIK